MCLQTCSQCSISGQATIAIMTFLVILDLVGATVEETQQMLIALSHSDPLASQQMRSFVAATGLILRRPIARPSHINPVRDLSVRDLPLFILRVLMFWLEIVRDPLLLPIPPACHCGILAETVCEGCRNPVCNICITCLICLRGPVTFHLGDDSSNSESDA